MNLGNTIEDYIRFVAAGPEKDIAKIKQPNLAKAVELVKEGEDKALKDLIKSRVPAVRQNELFSEIFPGAPTFPGRNFVSPFSPVTTKVSSTVPW